MAEVLYYYRSTSSQVMSDAPTVEALVNKQWETLVTIPVEDTLPQPDPADRLHAMIRQPTPKLRWLRTMDQLPSTAVTFGPLAAAGGCTAAVLSPFGMAGPEALQTLTSELGLPTAITPYDVAFGSIMGAGLAVLAGPHLHLLRPSLLTDGKVGTITATDGEGSLTTDLITNAPLQSVAGEITDAVSRRICYRAHQTTLAAMLGYTPTALMENDIYGAEITWRVDGRYDTLLKGPTIYEILEQGSLPLNRIGDHLLDTDVPTAVQSVCQARLPQQYRLDRDINNIRKKESDKPALRHIDRARGTSTYRDTDELTDKDQKRIKKLRQVRGDSLFDLNVRVLGVISNDIERRQLKKTVRRVTEVLESITNEYVTPEIDWFGGDGRLLADDPDVRLLQRFCDLTVETTPAYTAGVVSNKIRRNLVLDGDAVWSVLLLSGDGTPAVRDAHDTVPPSQRLDQRPGSDVQDWLVDDGEAET